jgi:hypothetical protein
MANRLSVVLGVNDKQFQTSLKKNAKKLKQFGEGIARTGRTLTNSLTLPIGLAGVASIKMASDFEESLNKTRVAFGDTSTEVEAFAKTTLTNFGLAEGSALDMASMFGDMATSMGLTQKQAGGMATSLVGLAGDLASFKNIGIEQAETALAGIFTGETESLKKLGIVMTEANLKQFGYNKNMSQAEKIGIRYKAIIEATKNAQGDYLRTSDGVANSSRTLMESVKELSTQFGTMLLPLASKLIAKGQELVNFFRGLSTEQKETIVQVAGVVAVVGPLLMLFGKFVALAGPVVTAIRMITAAMMTNPYLAVAAAIAFLITKIIYFATSTSAVAVSVRNRWRKMANGIIEAINSMLPALNLVRKLKGKIALDPIEPFVLEEPLEKAGDAATEAANAMKDLNSAMGQFKPLELSKDQKSEPKDKKDGKKAKTFDELFQEAEGAQSQMEGMMQGAFDNISIGEVFVSALQSGMSVLDMFKDKAIGNFIAIKLGSEDLANTTQNAFGAMADSQDTSLAGMASSAANAARDAIKMELSKAVASFMASALQSVPFPLNLAIAAAAGSVVGGLFNKIIPPFAEGGLVSGATLGMVGEGRGTSMVNPEVIAPLDKLQGMLNQGGSTQVFGRISGSDILLSSDRAKGNRNRTRGY